MELEPEEKTIEIARPELTLAENQKLLAFCKTFKARITKKAAAEILIRYGLFHPRQVFAWYGEIAEDEMDRLEGD